MKNKDSFYDNKVVFKPWGYEYCAYRNLNHVSITFLKINYGKKTSLHCHPKKKSGFILLKGRAEIQTGLSKYYTKNYNTPSKLTIRPGLFHSIKSKSKKGLFALEFESPVDKNDLVRFRDSYGRELKLYEGKNYTKKISEIIRPNYLKFKKVKTKKKQKHKIKNIEISLELHKSFKKILKEKTNTIFGVVDGQIIDDHKQKVLSYGDLIKGNELRELSKKFKIDKFLVLLKVKKID